MRYLIIIALLIPFNIMAYEGVYECDYLPAPIQKRFAVIKKNEITIHTDTGYQKESKTYQIDRITTLSDHSREIQFSARLQPQPNIVIIVLGIIFMLEFKKGAPIELFMTVDLAFINPDGTLRGVTHLNNCK
jgi:hypothetical protein